MSDAEPFGVDTGAGVKESEHDIGTSFAHEFDELFGDRTSPPVPEASTRGHGQELSTFIRECADVLVAHVKPFIPDDMAATAEQNTVIVLFALLTVVAWLVYKLIAHTASGPKRRSLMLYGPVGSGKTTLFYALQGKQLLHGSVTSMEANVGEFPVEGTRKVVRVVDVPGHPRKRSVFEEHSRSAAGVVFLLDAAEFVRQKAEIAGQLYDVLVTLAPSRPRVSVLLACNKTDLGSRAFSVDFIQKQLEKEIGTLRVTRQVQLGQDGAKADDGLCRPGDMFSFAECPVRVTTCIISARQAELAPVVAYVNSRF